jgi:plasmid stabilization system protein ParE
MNNYAVEFSNRAKTQIKNVLLYIAEDNASAVLKMVEKLETRARQLEYAPFIGVELPENEYPFLEPGYRKLAVKPFIIYYRVIGRTVYITHIIHSKRNQEKAFFEDE